MIGVLIDWQAETVDPHASRRFVSSLGAGLANSVGVRSTGRTVVAGVHLAARDRQCWRPCPLEDGGWLAFTGFIANAEALSRDLGSIFADDTALYAAGYAKWGDAIDMRALGEFATLIVHPDERRVRAVRSPIQAPPLHFRHDEHCAVVASTPRAVLAACDMRPEIDEQKIADSLYLNYSDAERGWYKRVRRLDVGTRVWLMPDGVRSKRFYDLLDAPSVRLKHDHEYVEAANTLFADGIASGLRGFDRPAVSLSGGLDSQAVAAGVLTTRPGQPLVGLTSVPEPGFSAVQTASLFEDERHHVAALAAMYPMLDNRLVESGDVPLDHKLTAMFLMAGAAPRNVLNFPWLHAVHERARQAGCDVLLKGSMGNLGFSFDGEGALPSWLARGNWFRLARELWGARGSLSMAHVLARDAVLPLLPPGIQTRLIRTPAIDPLLSWSPINLEYAARMHVRERAAAQALRRWPDTRSLRRAMLAGAGNEMGDIRQGFEAIHGLSIRDPTAYRPLLEFCVGLPDDQYLRRGTSRWLARRMLRNRIPAMVVDETRRGHQAADAPAKFGRVRSALIDELDALARDPAMAIRFDLPRLRTALHGWTPGSRFDRTERNALRLALPRVIATARFIRYVEGANG